MNAVVFDCDGVLVDSESIGFAVLAEMSSKYGLVLGDVDLINLRGASDDASYDYVAARAQLPPREDFLGRYVVKVRERFEADLVTFPDAAKAVAHLAAEGVPLAVATNAPSLTVAVALRVSGLARYFDAVISSDSVMLPKPAPHVYREAARALDVPPEACLAIEDSITGATSAAAAGMRVLTIARNGAGPAGFPWVSEIDAESILHWIGRR